MNTNTGAVYPNYEALDGDTDFLNRDRAQQLKDEIEDQEDELVELAGSPEKVEEAIDAIKQRAKSRGTHDPGKGLNRRELKRHLEQAKTE